MKMSVAGRGGERGGRWGAVTRSLETPAQGAADQLSDVFIAPPRPDIYKYPAQPTSGGLN